MSRAPPDWPQDVAVSRPIAVGCSTVRRAFRAPLNVPKGKPLPWKRHLRKHEDRKTRQQKHSAMLRGAANGLESLLVILGPAPPRYPRFVSSRREDGLEGDCRDDLFQRFAREVLPEVRERLSPPVIDEAVTGFSGVATQV